MAEIIKRPLPDLTETTTPADNDLKYTTQSGNSRRITNKNELKLAQKGQYLYTVDTGSTANVYSVTYDPAPLGVFDGMELSIKINTSNTGASTLQINEPSPSPRDISNENGSPLVGGELIAGRIYKFQYDLASANWIVKTSVTRTFVTKGWVDGLITSNNTSDANNDIDISPGHCSDSTGAVQMINNAILTKQLDAVWAQGNNLGGRASGAAHVVSKWYFLFAISKADGTFDAIFDDDVAGSHINADVLTSGFIYRRLIGFARTDAGTPNILAFTFIDGTYMFKTVTLKFADYAGDTPITLTPLDALTPVGIYADHIGRHAYWNYDTVYRNIFITGRCENTTEDEGPSMQCNNDQDEIPYLYIPLKPDAKISIKADYLVSWYTASTLGFRTNRFSL